MSDIQRYSVSGCGEMNCDPLIIDSDGPYVEYSDVKVIIAERDQLKSELETLIGLYNMHRETETREMRGLKAEIKSLRKNAERYQHLRKAGLVLEGHDFISFDEIADYRIDVAMGKEAK